MPRVLSLCDYTGIMVAPWVDAGCEATIVDLQHSVEGTSEGVTRLSFDVRERPTPFNPTDFDIVFAFPPCTDLANSGARWFREKGLRALIEALELVEACRELENPVGQLSTYWEVRMPMSEDEFKAVAHRLADCCRQRQGFLRRVAVLNEEIEELNRRIMEDAE